MRLWMSTYAERSRVGSSVVLSTALHVVIIGAAIVGTLSAPMRLEEALASRVQFLPPPDRVPARAGQSETLRFVTVAAGDKMGFDPKPVVRVPVAPLPAPKADSSVEPAVALVQQPVPSIDSVATALEVDSTVQRYPDSASPAYPASMLAKKIEGAVNTQYIVDTTGYADTTSLVILSTSEPEFARAVRDALPHMRFHPAIMANRKVRQLVSQIFLFKIQPSASDTAVIKKSGDQ